MDLSNDQRTGAMQMSAGLLQRGSFGAGFGPRQLLPQEPIPVQHPAGGLAAIFVPVSADGYLVGFFLVTPNLDLNRYSTFCTGADDIGRCPPLASWTDAQTISQTAGNVPGFEPRADPYLTYDGSPERLAWRVDGTDRNDKSATVYVTGMFAYPARPGSAPTGMIE